MKKPFGNISKIKKQKPLQQQDGKQQKKSVLQKIIQRPPTGKLKLDVNKPKGSIYDAIRKVDEQKQVGSGSVHKPTLGFKKNIKLIRNQPELSNQQNSNKNRQNEELQQQAQNVNSIPRPIPAFNRNKGKFLLGKSKEKPVISQNEDEKVDNQFNSYKNRMTYVNEDEQTSQSQQKGIEQQHKKLIKPNLFKKIGDKKAMKVVNNSPHGLNKGQRQLNNSEVYQEYEQGNGNKQKFNFQKMMNIQTAQINLQRKTQEVPLYKVQKQNKRTRQLSQLLNLQIDLYEQMVSISSTTPFQVYISKIKAGFLKNSCDQAFDQKSDVQTQTLSFQYVDFSNQSPQDYQMGHAYEYEQDESGNFDDFVLRIAPLIQQIIKPSKQVVMPPTSLLAFNPVFKKFLKCPSPTFIYFSQNHNFSFVAIDQKLFICQDQIQCALDLGGSKLAGLKNGKIVLWNGQNDRGSLTYTIVRDIIQSQNFQLPVYVTNDFDRLSPYLCEGSVVSLLAAEEQNHFYSFDSTAKLVKWTTQKVNRKTILTPKQIFEFSKILQKKHIVGFGVKRRNQIYYLWTSSGIVCWNGQTVTQKLEVSGIKDFYLPKRSSLVFCMTQFNAVQIFSIQYHECLDQIRLNIAEEAQQLIIPQLEHDNRQISIFYQIYLVTQNGSIYELKFTQKQVDCNKLSSGAKSEGQVGAKSKSSSNIIYQGINIFGNKIQKIKLFKDLKCITQSQQLGINLSTNVNNLKTILTKNKQFMANLMEKNMVFA